MDSNIKHRDYSLAIDEETLAATDVFCSPATGERGSILSLHGAGSAVRQRAFYLADRLAKVGFSTTAFDMSGHGESSGSMKESTLKRRYNQALGVARQMAKQPKIIVGSSMGGYIAATLIPDLKPDAIILICPALYATEAYDVPFDDKFSSILRRPGSYKDAHVLDHLRSFKGKALVMIGAEDKVIPQEVINLYIDALQGAKLLRHAVIPAAPHLIHGWAAENEANAACVYGGILNFLNQE